MKAGTITSPFAITNITVRGLFGYLDYDVPLTPDAVPLISKLGILYGDNGSGKTTILNLTYHLLSPRPSSGHKTYIAHTPFSTFRLTLSDSTVISATRDKPTIGTYTITVAKPNAKPVTYTFEVSHDGEMIKGEDDPRWSALLSCLSTVAPIFYYLGDDRVIHYESEASEETAVFFERMPSRIRRKSFPRGLQPPKEIEEHLQYEEEKSDNIAVALRLSISNVENLLRVLVSRQTSSGDASAHSIYTNIVGQLLSFHGESAKVSIKNIVDKLHPLEEQSRRYDKYGLAPPFDAKNLSEMIESAPQDRHEVAATLLAPYLDGLLAKYQAISEIYRTIDTFITHLATFMAPKKVTYRLNDGIRIYSPNQQILSPNMLSSGERNLLLILCGAVIATQLPRTLLIIDEPEISLNVKWQNKLLEALLDCTRNSAVQILVASHSAEMITPFIDHVLKLEPRKL